MDKVSHLIFHSIFSTLLNILSLPDNIFPETLHFSPSFLGFTMSSNKPVIVHRKRRATYKEHDPALKRRLVFLAVHEKHSVTQLAARFDIPRSSIYNLLSRASQDSPRVSFLDRRFNLTKAQEWLLEQWISTRNSRMVPVSKTDIIRQAIELSNKPDCAFSDSWWISFKERSKAVRKRADIKSLSRINAEDPQMIEAWFQMLRERMRALEIKPTELYNMDESYVVSSRTKHTWVLLKEPQQQPQHNQQPSRNRRGPQTRNKSRIVDVGTREGLTMMGMISSKGFPCPLFISIRGKVIPENRMDTLRRRLRDDLTFVHTNGNSHFVNKETIKTWTSHAVEMIGRIRKTGTNALLLLDNAPGHLGMEANQELLEANIFVMFFPKNLTHRIQPMDQQVLGNFKTQLSNVISDFEQEEHRQVKNKWDLIEITERCWRDTLSARSILKSWESTGLFPVDPGVVLDALD